MYIIDTHTHLYLEDFREDIDQIMERSLRAGVQKFYLPNIDSTSINDLLALEQQFQDTCSAMMGLHPCSVNDNYQQELSIVKGWLDKRPFAAVGETGLDYYWDRTFIEQQKMAFQQQIEWALAFDIPIVIHSRDSLQDCIEMIRQNQKGSLRGIFHCFGGTVEEARQIMDLNFLMGIGGVVTYKKSGLADVLQGIPLSSLVLETDAPFLTPVPFRGKRNEPSYLTYVIDTIAEAKNCATEEIVEATTLNAQKLFGVNN
jgi:TatD DNase family protein